MIYPGIDQVQLSDALCNYMQIAKIYKHVLATDASAAQLEEARAQAAADGTMNITYLQQAAEELNVPADSLDHLTDSQAFHWFDHDAFYRLAHKVTCSNCIQRLALQWFAFFFFH